MQYKIKAKNTIITTKEGKDYRIISVLGQGGMSVVYKAEYLIGNAEQPVLIKAFVMPDNIDSSEDFKIYIENELNINKDINRIGFPGAMPISYCVHDCNDETIYGIISKIHSGTTLRDYVSSKEYKYMSLKDKIILIKHLSQLVKNFHDNCKMIHGDITPDNIYVLDIANEEDGECKTNVLLYDFGNTQYIEDEKNIDPPFVSATDGYSVPDILFGKRKRLEKSDDWYAVLSCSWFCLSGKDITDFEITPENIDMVCQSYTVSYEKNGFLKKKDFSPSELIQFPIELGDIAAKIKKLFLDFDVNKESFCSNIRDIIDILERPGINRNNLRVELKKEYKNLHNNRFGDLNIIHKILPEVDIKLPKNLPHIFRIRGGGQKSLRNIMENHKNSLLLIGDGGMGKTTSLIDIMNETYLNENVDDEILVVFIELCTVSQNFEDWYTDEVGVTFLEQFLASYFTNQPRRFMEKNHPCISPLRSELFRKPRNGTPQYNILLDGMNEIGFLNERSKLLFFEGINYYIKHAKNLKIVITSRSDICELTTDNLLRLKAVGLSEESVKNVLREAVIQRKLSQQEYDIIIEKKNILYTSESRLWQCLKIPFFLMMYCAVSEKKDVSSQGEILRNFFQDKRETLDGKTTYGESIQIYEKQYGKQYSDITNLRMNWPIKVTLDFIIPEIALDMAVHNQFFINSQDMIILSDQYVRQVIQEKEPFQWVKSHYGYPTDIKEILEEMPDANLGERILGIACEMLGIMRCTADNMLFFTHQYFRDYFAASAIIHRMLNALEIKTFRNQDLNASADSFSKIVEPLHRHEFSFSVNALVGEILGEKKNLPVYDEINKTWHHTNFQTRVRPVITDFLDFYRDLDAKKGSQVHLGLRNVISILKSSRVNSYGKADLSGVDLSNLDLQGISLSGIVLSHFGENSKNVYSADLSRSKSVLEAIMHDDIKEDVKCCGIHSDQKHLALWNRTTGQISEFDIEEMAMKNLFKIDAYVKGVFYTPGSSSIWLVEAVKHIKKKSTGKNNLGNCILRNLRFKEANSIPERNEISKIKVYYYDCLKQTYFSHEFDNCEFIDVSYSKEFLQLSLFVKADNKVILKKLDISSDENMMPEKLIRVSKYELPLKSSDCQRISTNSFMHCRIDKIHYLISDNNLQNGSIGKWNIQDGKCESICYIDSLNSEESIIAFCKNSTNSKIYYLKNDVDYFESKNSKIFNNEFESIKDMYVAPCERIEFLENRNELLILSKKCLKLIDTNEEKTLWICSLAVEDFCLEHNTLIINTCDGIYDVDLLYGSYTCLYQFQEKEIRFVLGQTSLPTKVILYESTGNVKWICVENGCCERQVLLQTPNEKIEQVYCDCSDWIIYGISGQRIYCWNAISGAMLQNYKITYNPDEGYPQFCTFGSVQIVQVYFEMKDYSVFPMTKKYFVKDWDLKEQNWVHGNMEKKIHEKRFRKILSFHDYRPYSLRDAKKDMDGFIYGKGPYALEFELKDDDLPDAHWIDQENNKIKKFIKKITDKIYTDDDFDIFDEDISKEHMVLWKIPSENLKIGKKEISFSNGITELSRPRTIGETNHIIGVSAKKGMLYSTDNYSEYVDLRIVSLKNEEDFEMPALHGTEIENAFITGDTFVAMTKSLVNESRKLLFWNMEEKTNKIYIYQVRKNIIATGCKIDYTDDSREEKEILRMEGILSAEKFYFIK